MKQFILKFIGTGIFALLIASAFAHSSAFGQGKGARVLEGSWSVIVTLRNCQTQGVIRTIPRMITFAQGGTLHEYAVAGTAAMPVNRGPGHGLWSHSTQRNFSYALQFFRINGDTSYGGYVREARSVEVDETGDGFTATGTGTVYNPDGSFFPTCATEVGTRFE
jgi:hypothetical protein